MASYYPPKKSPLLAALIGVIPGFGHIYNEQVGKGVFLFSLCLGIFAMIVLTATGVQFMNFIAPGFYHGSVLGDIGHPPALMSKLFVVLSFFVFLPLLVIYSMADAATTAVKINRGEIPLGGYPTVGTPPPPPNQSTEQPGINHQEAMNMDTTQTMGTAANAGTGEPFTESDASASNTSETEGTTPENKDGTNTPVHPSKHGRLVLGIGLIALGFFFMVDDMRISFLEFENIWPLIPLFFGLRLLREYQIEHNHSQKVLGIIFTLFGGTFLVHNWTDFNVFDMLGDYWYLIPLVIGALILIKDFKDRRDAKLSKNGGEQS